jgi:hypothetical protein
VEAHARVLLAVVTGEYAGPDRSQEPESNRSIDADERNENRPQREQGGRVHGPPVWIRPKVGGILVMPFAFG